jgi:hypothetical protein
VAKPIKHYGKWRICWKDIEGKRRSAVYDNHRDADLALRRFEVEAEEARRGLRPPPPVERTFDDLIAHWRDHRAARKRSGEHALSIIGKHLAPAFSGLHLREIAVEHIDAFVAKATVGPKARASLCASHFLWAQPSRRARHFRGEGGQGPPRGARRAMKRPPTRR